MNAPLVWRYIQLSRGHTQFQLIKFFHPVEVSAITFQQSLGTLGH